MSTLQIQLDEELMERLRVAAEAQAVSLEVLAQAALESYVTSITNGKTVFVYWNWSQWQA